jgi:hypothetical protein
MGRSPDARRPVQDVAVSSQRRAVGGVPAGIARPRQVSVLAGTRRGADDAATPVVGMAIPFEIAKYPPTWETVNHTTSIGRC